MTETQAEHNQTVSSDQNATASEASAGTSNSEVVVYYPGLDECNEQVVWFGWDEYWATYVLEFESGFRWSLWGYSVGVGGGQR